jgi:sterol desaturase/sphingolipid hydroxylase (fatty acid hydroxylase superfamily)
VAFLRDCIYHLSLSEAIAVNWSILGVGAAWCVGSLVFGTFLEYWGHRFMHAVGWGPGKTHREHHARGSAQGVLLEFWEYFKYFWVFMWPPFYISMPAGMGWLLGANGFILFSAFAHQLQHENASKCFWMRVPLHFIHHAHNQWHHNFGVSVDIWDRVFGTYKPVAGQQKTQPQHSDPDRHIWQINWLWGGNAEANRLRLTKHPLGTNLPKASFRENG